MHLLEGLTADVSWNKGETDLQMSASTLDVTYPMVLNGNLLFHACLIDMRMRRSLRTESRAHELAATDDSDAYRLVSGSRRAVQDIDKTVDPS
ncbi:hypothetical protein BDR05DRAFT_962722 [Suillus weaverae]|nr:hypothetical protein BDR05DRAFT_962722 [Suillus weaverae]